MARLVRVRRQGRMVWLDKKTGQTYTKKPNLPAPKALPAAGESGGSKPPQGTSQPTTTRGSETRADAARTKLRIAKQGSNPSTVRAGQPGPTPPTPKPGSLGVARGLGSGISQFGLGIAANMLSDRLLKPHVERLGINMRRRLEGAINQVAYPDADGIIRRPDGSAMYAGPGGKDGTPLEALAANTRQKATPEEKAEVKAEVEAAEGSQSDSGFVDDKPSTPTRDKLRPMNTAETKAAGKDPMHVWALHNKQMILRNNNQRQKDILAEAEAAQNKTKLKTSAEKVGWQGRTGMY